MREAGCSQPPSDRIGREKDRARFMVPLRTCGDTRSAGKFWEIPTRLVGPDSQHLGKNVSHCESDLHIACAFAPAMSARTSGLYRINLQHLADDVITFPHDDRKYAPTRDRTPTPRQTLSVHCCNRPTRQAMNRGILMLNRAAEIAAIETFVAQLGPARCLRPLWPRLREPSHGSGRGLAFPR
jgi:hypothetical protein